MFTKRDLYEVIQLRPNPRRAVLRKMARDYLAGDSERWTVYEGVFHTAPGCKSLSDWVSKARWELLFHLVFREECFQGAAEISDLATENELNNFPFGDSDIEEAAQDKVRELLQDQTLQAEALKLPLSKYFENKTNTSTTNTTPTQTSNVQGAQQTMTTVTVQNAQGQANLSAKSEREKTWTKTLALADRCQIIMHIAKLGIEFGTSEESYDDALAGLKAFGIEAESVDNHYKLLMAAQATEKPDFPKHPKDIDLSAHVLHPDAQAVVDEYFKEHREKLAAQQKADMIDDQIETTDETPSKFKPIDPGLDPTQLNVIDAVFQSTSKNKQTFSTFMQDVNTRLKEATTILQDYEKLSKAAVAQGAAPVVAFAGDQTVPNGKVEMKKAWQVFKFLARSKKEKTRFDFDIPTWVWDAPHPEVPAVDDNFVFNSDDLLALLMSIKFDDPIWLTGPTGAGKSSIIIQVAAYTGFPIKRVNFDGSMDRLEFVGRDVLKTDNNGNTISEFVEGVLPRGMQGPCLFIMDEIDFIRPDVGAVLMPVLEKNGTPLVLSENGGKVIAPHPYFRIFATSNTKGTGDESRTYAGTRSQSSALRNRFRGGFLTVNYLPQDQETAMLKKRVPQLADAMVTKLIKFGNEVRRAFVQGQIMETCSPRDLFALGSGFIRYTTLCGMTDADAMERTLKEKLLNRCTQAEIEAIRKIRQVVAL